MNYLKLTLSILFLIISNLVFAANEGINRIPEEQKLYELSVVWKEISYNFGNMDSCPGLDTDSLYREYIPIVQNTHNDFEYFKAMQQFMAHFNNGHTFVEMPGYIWQELAFPYLITDFEEGKIIISMIGKHYSDKVNAGDEILMIDDIPALDYVEKYESSYVPASGIKEKLRRGLINPNSYSPISYADYKEKKTIKLNVKTSEGIETVNVVYDMKLYPSPNDTLIHNERLRNYSSLPFKPELKKENIFLTNDKNNFAYIRLLECNTDFHVFFSENYDEILNYDNLIVDIADNPGGDGRTTMLAAYSLVDHDSIGLFTVKTRIHNASHKAKAASRLYYYEDSEVPQEDKDLYYPYYYGTAFEDLFGNKFHNVLPAEQRYKGNIYIITSPKTASAAEQFATMVAQNPKTTLLGEKTAGANAQPLVLKLASGLTVFINTGKAIDINGVDISEGIIPHYTYDFSDFYKAEDPNELLSRFVEYIKGIKW